MLKQTTSKIASLTAMMVICLSVGLFWFVRRGHDRAQNREAAESSSSASTSPETDLNARDDSMDRVPRRAPAQLPPSDPTATIELRSKTSKDPKPAPSGLSVGPLPTPPFLRSEPRISGPPAVRQGFEARMRQAATLNRRLEARLGALRAEAQQAEPSQRQAIEHDISILEAQLEARRKWESDTDVPLRQ